MNLNSCYIRKMGKLFLQSLLIVFIQTWIPVHGQDKKLEEIRIRDPYVLGDPVAGTSYQNNIRHGYVTDGPFIR